MSDGSRLEHGATGYAVTWKKGTSCKGHNTHMGWGQRLRGLSGQQQVTIFMDAAGCHLEEVQDRNTQSWPESTSPPSAPRNRVSASRFGGALATRVLRATRSIVADGWAKQAANEPDAHGVEWLDFKDTASSGRDVSRSLGPSLTSQNENGRRP